MPGKTAGHITFLALCAKLNSLPTVIISTHGRNSVGICVQGLSLGACMYETVIIQIDLCTVCVCVYSICVYCMIELLQIQPI